MLFFSTLNEKKLNCELSNRKLYLPLRPLSARTAGRMQSSPLCPCATDNNNILKIH